MAEPVVGQPLYVLNKSAEVILKKYRKAIWVFPPGKPNLHYPDADRILGKYIDEILGSDRNGSHKHLAALMNTAALISDITPLFHFTYRVAMDALGRNAIRYLTTSGQGTAGTNDLKPGTYYVCGVFAMGRGTCAWNVQINLEPGENRLTLDNRNIVKPITLSKNA
ncbi:MAG TPA: hypothetical protein VGO50_00335 [Pyrinomonadaceae bacterium]|nr:hypothetical protein [Pyrinomonadaceae bacterium]